MQLASISAGAGLLGAVIGSLTSLWSSKRTLDATLAIAREQNQWAQEKRKFEVRQEKQAAIIPILCTDLERRSRPFAHRLSHPERHADVVRKVASKVHRGEADREKPIEEIRKFTSEEGAEAEPVRALINDIELNAIWLPDELVDAMLDLLNEYTNYDNELDIAIAEYHAAVQKTLVQFPGGDPALEDALDRYRRRTREIKAWFEEGRKDELQSTVLHLARKALGIPQQDKGAADTM
jgi:hypothetical protein